MALEEEEPERERSEDDEALDEGEVGGYLERGGVVGELYGEKPERRAQQQREDGDDRAAGPWLKAHAPGDAVEERERAGAREGRGRGEQRGEAAGDELSRLTDVEPERAQGDERHERGDGGNEPGERAGVRAMGGARGPHGERGGEGDEREAGNGKDDEGHVVLF